MKKEKKQPIKIESAKNTDAVTLWLSSAETQIGETFITSRDSKY